MKKTLVVFFKLVLCGSVLAAIAAIFLVVHPEEGVPEASAVITDFIPMDVLVGRDYSTLVANSGLRPKPYEINGQVVYLAAGKTELEPLEVLERYQKRFVAAGINTRAYTDVSPSAYKFRLQDFGETPAEADQSYNEELLTGGVVPIVKSPEYVAMGGVVPRSRARNLEELFEGWNDSFLAEDISGFDGFRFLDAQRVGDHTRLTSVWADKDFNWKQMSEPHDRQIAPDVDVPACMGCRGLISMRSLDPSEKYRANVYETTLPEQRVVNFYERAMKSRGWTMSDAARAMDYVRLNNPEMMPRSDAHLLHFSRDRAQATIAIIPDRRSGQTTVTTVHSF